MKRLSYVLLVVLICSCENKKFIEKQNGHFSKVEKYSSGQIKYEQEFIKRSDGSYIPDGVFIQYYENGQILDSVIFVNGEKDGIERTFYENGNKKSSFYYKKGILDSFGYVLHPNGKIAEWQNRENGVLLGVQYKLDSSQKPIQITFSTPIDSAAFAIYFTSGATKDKTIGVPLYVLEEKHNVTVNDTFRTINFLPQFGKIRAKLHLTIENEKSIILDKKINEFKRLWNGYSYLFEHRFLKAGNYNYTAIIELYDSTNMSSLKIDTVRSIIEVF